MDARAIFSGVAAERMITPLRFGLFAAAAAVVVAASPATARVDLTEWSYDALASGWSAERMIENAEVKDPDGQTIGQIEDFIVGPDGRIRKVVIEAGGFLDIGDTHFAYDWSKARITGPNSIEVMLDRDNIESYSLFEDIDDQPPAKARNWRLSELINDYAHAREGVRYGWIDDAIISQDGTVLAIIVSPDVTYGRPGPYAVPFHGFEDGFDPATDFTMLPYTPAEIAELDVYVYGRFMEGEGGNSSDGAGGSAEQTDQSGGGKAAE